MSSMHGSGGIIMIKSVRRTSAFEGGNAALSVATRALREGRDAYCPSM